MRLHNIASSMSERETTSTTHHSCLSHIWIKDYKDGTACARTQAFSLKQYAFFPFVSLYVTPI